MEKILNLHSVLDGRLKGEEASQKMWWAFVKKEMLITSQLKNLPV